MTPLSSSAPKAVLVRSKVNPSWRIELVALGALSGVLGEDVLTAFCRCFVHCDRLTSLATIAELNSLVHNQPDLVSDRNLHTIFWFSVGRLRELSLAVRDLRSALARRGLLDPNSADWIALREVEERWDRDPFFRELRNKVSFHVDREAVRRGLDLLKEEKPVTLSEGYGGKAGHVTMQLGPEALATGLQLPEMDFQHLAETTAKDHEVSLSISRVFVSVLMACNIPYELREK